MVPFLIYVLAALFTINQLAYLLRLTWSGLVYTPSMSVAFLGACILILAAFLSMYRFKAAVAGSTVGLLAEWSFFAPTHMSFLMNHSWSPDHSDFIIVLPTILLIIATFYSILAGYWIWKNRVAMWYMPIQGSSTNSKAIAAVLGVYGLLFACIVRLYA